MPDINENALEGMIYIKDGKQSFGRQANECAYAGKNKGIWEWKTKPVTIYPRNEKDRIFLRVKSMDGKLQDERSFCVADNFTSKTKFGPIGRSLTVKIQSSTCSMEKKAKFLKNLPQLPSFECPKCHLVILYTQRQSSWPRCDKCGAFVYPPETEMKRIGKSSMGRIII